MADPQPDQGFFPGLLGKVGNWVGSYDPQAAYGGLLTDEATKQQFRIRELGAVAASMAANSMPVPYKGGTPWGSFLGAAGGAAATAGDSLMKARLEAAQAGLANTQIEGYKAMGPMYQAIFDEAKRNAGGGGGGAAGTGGASTGAPGAPAKGTDITPQARLGTGDPKAAQALLDGQYGDLIKQAAAQYNLDPVKYAAQLYTESGGDPNKVGPGKGDKQAQGMAQITPGTQAHLGITDPFDAKQSIFGGARYMREGIDAFPDDYTKALKYYYSGSTDEKTWGAATNGYPGLVYSHMPKPDQTAAVPPAVPGAPAPAAAAVPPARSLLDPRGAPLLGGALDPGAEGAPAAVRPPAAPAGAYTPQDASGGAYSVPPPPSPPPNPGEYDKHAAVLPGGGAPPGGATPVSAGGATPGLMTPQDAVPVPRMPGRFGAIPTALANGPGAAPSGGPPPEAVALASANGGPTAAAPAPANAPAAAGPGPGPQAGAAPPQLPPGATVGEGGVVVPGLMTPQGPAAAGPQATPPVTPGPQAAPRSPFPPVGPPPQLPALPSQMPAITAPPVPQATPGQAAAMGIAGISALIGKPAPEWIQQMAAMPGQQAMETFKSWLQVQQQGMTARDKAALDLVVQPYQKQIEAATAAQYKTEVYRPGAGVGIGGQPPTSYAPEHITAFNPATQRMEHATQTNQPNGPPIIQFSGIPSAPSEEERAGAAERGRIKAGQEPLPVPQQPAAAPGPPPYQGYQLAPGMMSKEPDYQEPQYNETQLKAGYAPDNWPKTTKELTASIGAAQGAEQRLTNIAGAFQQVGTRAFTTDKAAWNNTLDGVFGPGGGPAWLRTSTDAGAVMTALHETQRAMLLNLKSAQPHFANAEFQSLSKMSENPDLPVSANLNMLAEDIATLRQQQALAHGWIEARANGRQDPDLFQAKWLKQNPLAPIVEAVKKEIGIGQLAPANPIPADLPKGTTYGGTSGGRPFYVLPNGNSVWDPGQGKQQ